MNLLYGGLFSIVYDNAWGVSGVEGYSTVFETNLTN
jgi:hypothetical protein